MATAGGLAAGEIVALAAYNVGEGWHTLPLGLRHHCLHPNCENRDLSFDLDPDARDAGPKGLATENSGVAKKVRERPRKDGARANEALSRSRCESAQRLFTTCDP